MPFARFLTRWVLGRADRCIVHAETSANQLAELVPKQDIVSTPMPSLLVVEPSGLPPHPPLKTLFLGFVRPYKGLDVALDAVRILVERGMDVQLTVSGEFWEPVETWQERVREAGLEQRVTLRPGYASDDTVRELLATHHVLVAPYRSATQSGVIPIAIAAGRPVVATDVGGLAEQVRDGVDGAVVAPDDPEAFADGIERVAGALEALAAGACQREDAWSVVVDVLTA
jgi:glycosyltransferase involved in cell wall biosynthesis